MLPAQAARICGGILLGAGCSLFAGEDHKKHTAASDPVAGIVCRVLEISHYSSLKINAIEWRALGEFSEMIDPLRILLTQSDIAAVEGEIPEGIKDDVESGTYKAAMRLVGIAQARCREFSRFVEQHGGEVERGGPIIWRRLGRLRDYEQLADRWNLFLSFCKTRGDSAKQQAESAARNLGFLEGDLMATRDLFLDALAKGFDQHSEYQKPRRREEFERQMSLTQTTTGVVAERTHEGKIVIKESQEGGPSVGQEIISVSKNGEDMKASELPDEVLEEYLGGADGKSVSLKLEDSEGNVKQSVLTADESTENQSNKARAEIVEHRGKNIGFLTVPLLYTSNRQRNGDSGIDALLLIERLRQAGAQALVIDMRGNSGGGIAEASMLAGAFLGNKVIAYGTDRNNTSRPFLARGRVRFDGPVVCLVDAETGSAAELLARALQYYRRGLVVGGGRTMGKGTGQSVLDFSNHGFWQLDNAEKVGALKVSTILICGPDGMGIQGKGVTPDITVPDGMQIAQRIGELSGRGEKVAGRNCQENARRDNPAELSQLVQKSLSRVGKSAYFANADKVIREAEQVLDDEERGLSSDEGRGILRDIYRIITDGRTGDIRIKSKGVTGANRGKTIDTALDSYQLEALEIASDACEVGLYRGGSQM